MIVAGKESGSLKAVAIVQTGQIPWKGYSDLMRLAGEFVPHGDMRYARRDWRKRNGMSQEP
ncbi:MAG TPA: WbqC family protein [Burkholderiales bacterium]